MSLEVFVGGYGPAADPGIHAFAFDPAGAGLHLMGSHAGIENPSFVAVHPNGGHLYAVSETGGAAEGAGGRVHALRVERTAGAIALIPLNHRRTDGDHPCHLRIDPTGRWLAVSNYGTGSVAVFPIDTDGSLGGMASSARHAGRGFDPKRQEGPHAHSAVFSPDGRFLLVADLGLDRLVVYRFDGETGGLRRHREVATDPGAGPRHTAFHPDGVHVFVVGELDNTLRLFTRHDDELESGPSLATVPPGESPSLAADVQVSPAGRHVFVSNRGHDSVAVFEFDASAGLLRRAGIRPCGGSWPRGLGLAPDGRHLLVANRRSNEIVVLPVAGSGIGAPAARAPVPQPSNLAIVERP
jgi:6-phosphogluconolactonase